MSPPPIVVTCSNNGIPEISASHLVCLSLNLVSLIWHLVHPFSLPSTCQYWKSCQEPHIFLTMDNNYGVEEIEKGQFHFRPCVYRVLQWNENLLDKSHGASEPHLLYINDLCPKAIFGIGEWREGSAELCTWENSLLQPHLVGLHSSCTPVVSHPKFRKILTMNFYNLIKKKY